MTYVSIEDTFCKAWGRWAMTAEIPPPGEYGVSYVAKAIF
jgi:hypothetical protein